MRGLISFLFYGFDVDVCGVEKQFLSAFGTPAVEALNDFVGWGQLDTFIEDGSTLLTHDSLRHPITPLFNTNTKTPKL